MATRLLALGLSSSSGASASSSAGLKKCGGAPGAWGSNVSCPATALGCIPRKMGGDRRKWLDGYPWSCVMPSIASPGKNTTCATGAPYPLSTTKRVRFPGVFGGVLLTSGLSLKPKTAAEHPDHR